MSAEYEIAEMRYYELYKSMPGEWVCGYFCGALDTGCIPWEKFGYRGNTHFPTKPSAIFSTGPFRSEDESFSQKVV